MVELCKGPQAREPFTYSSARSEGQLLGPSHPSLSAHPVLTCGSQWQAVVLMGLWYPPHQSLASMALVAPWYYDKGWAFWDQIARVGRDHSGSGERKKESLWDSCPGQSPG